MSAFLLCFGDTFLINQIILSCNWLMFPLKWELSWSIGKNERTFQLTWIYPIGFVDVNIRVVLHQTIALYVWLRRYVPKQNQLPLFGKIVSDHTCVRVYIMSHIYGPTENIKPRGMFILTKRPYRPYFDKGVLSALEERINFGQLSSLLPQVVRASWRSVTGRLYMYFFKIRAIWGNSFVEKVHNGILSWP